MITYTINIIFILAYLILNGPNPERLLTIENGLPDNQVRSIKVLEDRGIWFGTTKGVAFFDNLSKTDLLISRKEIESGIPSIFEDSKGRIWFGSVGYLYMLENDSLRTFSISKDLHLNGRLVFSIFEDNENQIWVATTGGAAFLNGSNWNTVTAEDGLLNNVVHDIKQTEDNTIWFATRNGGISLFSGGKWSYYFTDKNCRKLLFDTKENMWIGTSTGLIKYDGVTWKVLDFGHPVLPMFEGEKGTVWATTDSKEILRISADLEIIRYQDLSKGSVETFYYLEKGMKGRVWAGTDIGVLLLN